MKKFAVISSIAILALTASPALASEMGGFFDFGFGWAEIEAWHRALRPW